MKKSLLFSTVLFLSTVLLNSCGSKEKGEDKSDDTWSEENKTKFVEECAKGGAPEATCKCMVDKMAEKYSSVAEAKKAMEEDKDVAMAMAMECI